MKQLKYIKLFEAFESVRLTKTLGYIDTKSRERFIDYLKRLCKKSEFPISQLSDEMFQYLPYNKALKVSVDKEDKPCQATSKSEFNRQHAIEGEKCEGGRIKRLWGGRPRAVECPNCKGSGIEPVKEDIKLVKFWFSKDGSLINTTGCDGSVKDSPKMGNFESGEVITSHSSDMPRLQSIPHLTRVALRTGRRESEVQAILYKERRDIFCIQDRYEGGTPSGRDWQKYGRFSWNISGGDFISITVLNKVGDTDEKSEEIDPLTYNFALSFGWSGIGLDKRQDVENLIKDAHFALVFDWSKVKSGDFKKVPEIRSEREELKAGSRLTVKDEDIRRENIDRYMKKIAEKSDLVKDISNVKSVVNRILGGQNSIFMIVGHSSYERKFSHLIVRYLEILNYKEKYSEESDELKYVIGNLKSTIQSSYESVSTDVNDVRKCLDYCTTELKKEEKSEYLELIKELQEVSQMMNQKIMSLPFDCIEDLEIVKSKVSFFRSLFTSDTYGLGNLRYFIDDALNGREKRSLDRLVNEWRLSGENLEKTKKGLQTVKKIILRS
jgi:hypothetical protein